MARKSRIEYAGAYYHVINRGNYRMGIFESEGARKRFFDCLEEASVAQGWRLHAWVLMSRATQNTVLRQAHVKDPMAIRFACLTWAHITRLFPQVAQRKKNVVSVEYTYTEA